MSTIRQRENGRWQLRYKDPDGKWRAQDFAKKEQAERSHRTIVAGLVRGDWTDPAAGKVTVSELWEQWIESRDIKPKTRADYLSLWSTCLEPVWGEKRVNVIRPLAVQTWVTNMTGVNGQQLSASRRRQAHGLLASLLDAAVLDQRIPTNPARAGLRSGGKSYLPKLSSGLRRRYLTHAEVEALAQESGEYATLVRLLSYTGLRWGEAVALRVVDIDLLRGRVHVERSVAEVGGELIYGPTKTHQVREVVVPPFLRDELAAQAAGRARADLLFTTAKGAPIRSYNFRRRVFEPALVVAGIEPLRIHDLRHTAAGLAVDSGANVKGVQRMLGHADAAMTLNRYADLFDGHLEAVADRLAEAREQALSSRPSDKSRTMMRESSVTHLPTTVTNSV